MKMKKKVEKRKEEEGGKIKQEVQVRERRRGNRETRDRRV